MCAAKAGWDYDVEVQGIQARLLDLNSVMPGALRRLDNSRVALTAARRVRGACGLHARVRPPTNVARPMSPLQLNLLPLCCC